jgi:hypothetical protein
MKRHLVMMCVLSLCAAILSWAAPARAQGTSPPSTENVQAAPAAVKTDQHCVARRNRPLQCFGTEAEALYSATNGRIRLPAGGSARSLSDAELFGTRSTFNAFGAISPNSTTSTIQAILYVDANYGGASLILSDDFCNGGWNNLSGSWNDVVSSAKTASCGVTLYENANLGGISLSISPPGTSYVGNTMNDKASSWSLP